MEQQTNITILGKAYPQESKKYKDTVCTSGVTSDNKLIRIYPVPYRYLKEEGHYKKWDIIRTTVSRNEKEDKRLESHKITNIENITVINSVKNKKREQIKLISSLESLGCSDLENHYKNNFGSLGIIRIIPFDFYWSENEEFGKPVQEFLFDELKSQIEIPPIVFKIKYKCYNENNCSVKKGYHDKQVLAWEFYQSLRNFNMKYNETLEESLNRVKNAFWKRFDPSKKVIFALLGTHSLYPNVWMFGDYFTFDKDLYYKVLKEDQLSLF